MDDVAATDPHLNRLRLKLDRARPAPRPAPGSERKAAAVLIPLVRRQGIIHVVYTRRSDQLVSHRGQVAFPGGRFDSRDADLLAAALREAHEETGIIPSSVEVLGTFPGMTTFSTGINVTPFVGVIPGSQPLRPDPKEVAEIFDVPLHALSDPRYRGSHRWPQDGVASDLPAILYGGQTIWGLTYNLTLALLKLIG